jgi:hypothetical protein
LIFKKQRSTDYTIGRLCLFPKEVLTLQDYDHPESVQWIYILDGSILLDHIDDTTNTGRDIISAKQLFSLQHLIESSIKITAGLVGCTAVILMTNDENLMFKADLLDIKKDYTIEAVNDQFVIPLVSDLVVFNNTIPPTAIVRLPANKNINIQPQRSTSSPHALLISSFHK